MTDDKRQGPYKRFQRNWKGGNTERWIEDWGNCTICGEQLHKGNTRSHDRNRFNLNKTCGRCYLQHKAEQRKRLGRR